MPTANQQRCALKSRCCNRSFEQNTWCGRKFTQGQHCTGCSLTFCSPDCYTAHPCGQVPKRWSKALANLPFSGGTGAGLPPPQTVTVSQQHPPAASAGPSSPHQALVIGGLQHAAAAQQQHQQYQQQHQQQQLLQQQQHQQQHQQHLGLQEQVVHTAALIAAVQHALDESGRLPASFASTRRKLAAEAAEAARELVAQHPELLPLGFEEVVAEMMREENEQQQQQQEQQEQQELQGGEEHQHAAAAPPATGGGGDKPMEEAEAHEEGDAAAAAGAEGGVKPEPAGSPGPSPAAKRRRGTLDRAAADTLAAGPRTAAEAVRDLVRLRAERSGLEGQLELERSHYRASLASLLAQLQENQRQLALEASSMYSMQAALVESVSRVLPDELLRHCVARLHEMQTERAQGTAPCPFPVTNHLVNQRYDSARQLLAGLTAQQQQAQAQQAAGGGAAAGGGGGADGGDDEAAAAVAAAAVAAAAAAAQQQQGLSASLLAATLGQAGAGGEDGGGGGGGQQAEEERGSGAAAAGDEAAAVAPAPGYSTAEEQQQQHQQQLAAAVAAAAVAAAEAAEQEEVA